MLVYKSMAKLDVLSHLQNNLHKIENFIQCKVLVFIVGEDGFRRDIMMYHAYLFPTV